MKATPAIRQSNAAAKALATVAALHVVPSPAGEAQDVVSSDDELSPGNEVPEEKVEEAPLPKAATAEQLQEPAPEPTQVEPSSLKRGPSEDFYDYLARIPHEDWASGKTAGLYILKENPAGKGNIQLDRVHQAITHDQFINLIAPKYGPGNYVLQFQTAEKRLTACSHRVTYDGPMVNSTGGSNGNPVGGYLSGVDSSGVSKYIETIGSIAMKTASSGIDAVRAQQTESNKPVDVAAIITACVTAFTAMQPKNDGDSALIKLLEGQRKDAEDRAKTAKEDADRQRQRDKEEASGQRERDQQFFTMMKGQSDGMNAILLKQAESKSDTMTQMTSLITSFMTVREKIEDSLGGGGPKGWEGVVGQLIDRAPDAIAGVSALMAARNGATPQQVQALQGQQPAQPQQPQIENEFQELVHRLGKYVSRDTGLWLTESGIAYIAGEPADEEDEDSNPIPGMIQVEYPAIFEGLFVGQPKEAIIASINATQIGAAILANPQGSEFLNKVVDSIKLQMVPGADKPEEVPAEPVRKNGKAKAHA